MLCTDHKREVDMKGTAFQTARSLMASSRPSAERKQSRQGGVETPSSIAMSSASSLPALVDQFAAEYLSAVRKGSDLASSGYFTEQSFSEEPLRCKQRLRSSAHSELPSARKHLGSALVVSSGLKQVLKQVKDVVIGESAADQILSSAALPTFLLGLQHLSHGRRFSAGRMSPSEQDKPPTRTARRKEGREHAKSEIFSPMPPLSCLETAVGLSAALVRTNSSLASVWLSDFDTTEVLEIFCRELTHFLDMWESCYSAQEDSLQASLPSRSKNAQRNSAYEKDVESILSSYIQLWANILRQQEQKSDVYPSETFTGLLRRLVNLLDDNQSLHAYHGPKDEVLHLLTSIIQCSSGAKLYLLEMDQSDLLRGCVYELYESANSPIALLLLLKMSDDDSWARLSQTITLAEIGKLLQTQSLNPRQKLDASTRAFLENIVQCLDAFAQFRSKHQESVSSIVLNTLSAGEDLAVLREIVKAAVDALMRSEARQSIATGALYKCLKVVLQTFPDIAAETLSLFTRDETKTLVLLSDFAHPHVDTVVEFGSFLQLLIELSASSNMYQLDGESSTLYQSVVLGCPADDFQESLERMAGEMTQQSSQFRGISSVPRKSDVYTYSELKRITVFAEFIVCICNHKCLPWQDAAVFSSAKVQAMLEKTMRALKGEMTIHKALADAALTLALLLSCYEIGHSQQYLDLLSPSLSTALLSDILVPSIQGKLGKHSCEKALRLASKIFQSTHASSSQKDRIILFLVQHAIGSRDSPSAEYASFAIAWPKDEALHKTAAGRQFEMLHDSDGGVHAESQSTQASQGSLAIDAFHKYEEELSLLREHHAKELEIRDKTLEHLKFNRNAERSVVIESEQSTYSKQISGLKEKQMKLMQEKDNQAKNVRDLECTMIRYEATVEDMEEEENILRSKVNVLEIRLDEVAADLSTAKEELTLRDREIADMAEQIAKLSESEIHREETLAKCDQKIQTMKTRADEQATELEALYKKMVLLAKAYQAKTDECEAMQEKLVRANSEVSRKLADYESIRKALCSKEDEIRQLRDQASASEATAKELRCEKLQVVEQQQELRQKVCQLEDKIKRLKGDLRGAGRIAQKLEEQKNEREREHANQLKDLRAEMQTKDEQLRKYTKLASMIHAISGADIDSSLPTSVLHPSNSSR